MKDTFKMFQNRIMYDDVMITWFVAGEAQSRVHSDTDHEADPCNSRVLMH